VGAICLAILLAFIVFFAPAEGYGVERLKQRISVREQLARDVFKLSAPGGVLPLCDRVRARALHLARTCAVNSAGLLAGDLGQ
jgi:hypothetical protein